MTSIRKVTDIVADIANASVEQSTGVEQINKALAQMDEVTQQNSALVEENAATAKTLEHQAKAMDDQVAYFKVGGREIVRASAVKRPVDKPAPAPKKATSATHDAEPANSAKAPAAKPQKPVVQLKQVASDTSGGPVRKMQETLATAVNADANWQEF